MMQCAASYHQGFYSPARGGEPLHNALWRGCVGAWCPSLGNEGVLLLDHSGFDRHGIWTSGAAWSSEYQSVRFDATNDMITLPTTVKVYGNAPFTLCWWERVVSTTNAYPARFRLASNTQTFGVFRTDAMFYSTLSWGEWAGANGTKAAITSLASSVGIWRHVAIVSLSGPNVATASEWRAYDNGLPAIVNGGSMFNVYGGTVSQIGWDSLNHGADCDMDDIRLYNRALSGSEVTLLASERGIAYRLRRRARVAATVAPATRTLVLPMSYATVEV